MTLILRFGIVTVVTVEGSVVLTRDQGITPFLIDTVLNLIFEIVDSTANVGWNDRCLCDKLLKNTLVC